MVSYKNIANAVGGKTARACDNCIRKRARWYCAADDAFLCQSCDSSVHSANSLARRHERVRLKSASSENINININNCNSSPSWHKGFTKKARTPRPGNSSAVRLRKKSDEVLSLLPNPFFSLVPEGDETTEHEHEEEEEDEKLLYRVPIFDPFVGDNENESRVLDKENLHGGFLPSDMDLAEFAADVESLLGRNLENECFDMEGLGLMNCEEKDIGCSLSDGKVKLEEEREEICGKKFVTEIDLMKEPFELNFEDYDDVPSSCNEQDEKTGIGGAVAMTMAGVKNERENYDDELKMKKKKKVGLSLDCDAVIAAWGGDRSPWTNGERPDFYPEDDCWPDCMATCGVLDRHSCGDFGIIGGHPTAMTDGGREARVSRYREKRRTRLFSKKIRYEVRKLNAEKRPRMKGRFVKRTPFAPPNLPILTIN